VIQEWNKPMDMKAWHACLVNCHLKVEIYWPEECQHPLPFKPEGSDSGMEQTNACEGLACFFHESSPEGGNLLASR
jgi:hypothetical protein